MNEEKVKQQMMKLANSLANFPFKNMPLTNGSLLGSIVPCLFVMISSDFALLYGVWHIFFCGAIILDKAVNEDAK